MLPFTSDGFNWNLFIVILNFAVTIYWSVNKWGRHHSSKDYFYINWMSDNHQTCHNITTLHFRYLNPRFSTRKKHMALCDRHILQLSLAVQLSENILRHATRFLLHMNHAIISRYANDRCIAYLSPMIGDVLQTEHLAWWREFSAAATRCITGIQTIDCGSNFIQSTNSAAVISGWLPLYK